jgi:hypothetical protein
MIITVSYFSAVGVDATFLRASHAGATLGETCEAFWHRVGLLRALLANLLGTERRAIVRSLHCGHGRQRGFSRGGSILGRLLELGSVSVGSAAKFLCSRNDPCQTSA